MQHSPSMEDLANRFSILQRRFVEFSERVPSLLRIWLSQRGVSSVEISFETLVNQLFLLEGSCNASGDILSGWVATIARYALEDQLQAVPFTQYGASRKSVVFLDIPATVQVEWQQYSRTCVALCPPEEDTAALRRRNSLLEIRVLELEASLAGRASATASSFKRPETPPVPFSLGQCSVDNTHAFLLQKRFEAEDSIRILHRLREEFAMRERALDLQTTQRINRIMDRQRSETTKMRQDLRLAADEVVSLRVEVDHLRAMNQCEPQPKKVDSFGPIAPRRALRLAGFWGVSQNDVLCIVPLLVAKYSSITGKSPKRHCNQYCFPSDEMENVIIAVVEVMREHYPAYQRVSNAGRAV